MNRIAFTIVAVVVGGLALAAPVLRLNSNSKSNGVVTGEAVNISAYSQLPIVSRSNSGLSVVLVYKGKDAAEPFKFYETAFEKNGWKVGHAMGGGDAMGGAMDKPADTMGGTMDKPANAMDKPASAMDKPASAMDKPGDAMGGTMDKGLEASLTFKKMTITLKSSLVGTDQIKVSFDLK